MKKVILLSIFIFLIIFSVLVYTPFFKINEVLKKGGDELTNEVYDKMLSLYDKNLFLLDTNAIEDEIEKNPKVQSVEISKKFPSKLLVTIKYRVPILEFNHSNNYFAVDIEDIVIDVKNEKSDLPQLEGFILKKVAPGEIIIPSPSVNYYRAKEIVEIADAMGYKNYVIKNEDDNLSADFKDGFILKMGTERDIEKIMNLFVDIKKELNDNEITSGIINCEDIDAPFYSPANKSE